jgi:hypothetical protein
MFGNLSFYANFMISLIYRKLGLMEACGKNRMGGMKGG